MSAENDGSAWEAFFSQLEAFRSERGHVNIPCQAPDYAALRGWVDVQKASRKSLSDDKLSKLESLGLFENETAATGVAEEGGSGGTLTKAEQLRLKWNDMYERLVQYRAKYGDCVVPRSYPDDKALGHWCGNQRMLFKRKTLQEDRLEKLRAIDFSFVVDERYLWTGGRNTQHLDEHWTKMYRALSEYRSQHGDVLVPKGYVHGSGVGAIPLGRWVSRQRTALTQGTLVPERKAQLDLLGFSWKPCSSKPLRVVRKRQRDSYSGVAALTTEPPSQPAIPAQENGRSRTSSERTKKKKDALAILA
jgi:hypothetical protein